MLFYNLITKVQEAPEERDICSNRKAIIRSPELRTAGYLLLNIHKLSTDSHV